MGTESTLKPPREVISSSGPMTFEAEFSNQGNVTEPDAPAGPLTVKLRKAVEYPGGGVRRLTPTECERLMGWPDGWTIPASGSSSALNEDRCPVDPLPDGRRFGACGDGVVAPVAEWIGRRLLPHVT